jgi:putative addiction module component (TIGR02574 family)
MRLSPDEMTRLSPDERLALFAQLWDRLGDEHVPVTASLREELDRRLATLDEDRAQGVTWEALKAELEQRNR